MVYLCQLVFAALLPKADVSRFQLAEAQVRKGLIDSFYYLQFQLTDLLCSLDGYLHEFCKVEETVVRQCYWS